MGIIMNKISVIIPSKQERFLQQTIDDLLVKAKGDIEVIVILDGYWPDPPLKEDSRVLIIHWGEGRGLRPAVNAGVAMAKGKYVMKIDAHCMFAEGFDEILKNDCDENWLVIPRRVSLDAFEWKIAETGRPPIDYEYISYPYAKELTSVRKGNIWYERIKERVNILIDEDMSFQGSCWFMRKSYFENLGSLRVEGWGTFVLEPEELGNKVWLSGGKVMINKKLWYAHWHKGKEHGRGYFIDRRNLIRGRVFNVDFWMNNKWIPDWPKQEHPFEWLIEHFWPVPGWPNDWKKINGKRNIYEIPGSEWPKKH